MDTTTAWGWDYCAEYIKIHPTNGFLFLRKSLILELERRMLWKPKDLTSIFRCYFIDLCSPLDGCSSERFESSGREWRWLTPHPCIGRDMPCRGWHTLYDHFREKTTSVAWHWITSFFPSVPTLPNVGSREKEKYLLQPTWQSESLVEWNRWEVPGTPSKRNHPGWAV